MPETRQGVLNLIGFAVRSVKSLDTNGLSLSSDSPVTRQ